jgi:uncharacterized damage-inducible protein DinB
VARAFVDASRAYLRDEYPAKIRLALERLPDDDLWWRPNPASNSAGNLVLHLAGNVRQWIVHGLGGAPDTRRRAEEFAAAGTSDRAGVLSALDAALNDADDVLRTLDPATLPHDRTIQGLRVTGLQALYHVVEHFSMHTGQILWLVKLRTDRGLGFYDVDEEGRVRGTRW